MRAIILLMWVSVPAFASCPACDLIEKSGASALEEIKKLPAEQLKSKDADGKTPYYWSVLHGTEEIRTYLEGRLPAKDLLNDPAHMDILDRCGWLKTCKPSTLKHLLKLGFRPQATTLIQPLLSGEECSVEKFQLLLKTGAPVRSRDLAENNFLHQLADRSRQGKPMAPRECLLKGISLLRKADPSLIRSRNQAGKTPRELAQSYVDAKDFGSYVTAKHMEPIIRALK